MSYDYTDKSYYTNSQKKVQSYDTIDVQRSNVQSLKRMCQDTISTQMYIVGCAHSAELLPRIPKREANLINYPVEFQPYKQSLIQDALRANYNLKTEGGLGSLRSPIKWEEKYRRELYRSSQHDDYLMEKRREERITKGMCPCGCGKTLEEHQKERKYLIEHRERMRERISRGED